jgi:hypothetical protein
MCISNEIITDILKVQRRRKLARIRYFSKTRDGYNRIVGREGAVAIVENLEKYRDKITFEEWLNDDFYYSHFQVKPDIVKTSCPIPHFPPMPLTVCLNCVDERREK